MSELPRDNDADDGNNDEINDPSAWIVLDCVEADELNENEDASAEILGVSKSEMLCLPCSRDSVRNFRKAYRIRGNNAGVRGFGTSKSTFYRKKTLERERNAEATTLPKITDFFGRPSSETCEKASEEIADDDVGDLDDDGSEFGDAEAETEADGDDDESSIDERDEIIRGANEDDEPSKPKKSPGFQFNPAGAIDYLTKR